MVLHKKTLQECETLCWKRRREVVGCANYKGGKLENEGDTVGEEALEGGKAWTSLVWEMVQI